MSGVQKDRRTTCSLPRPKSALKTAHLPVQVGGPGDSYSLSQLRQALRDRDEHVSVRAQVVSKDGPKEYELTVFYAAPGSTCAEARGHRQKDSRGHLNVVRESGEGTRRVPRRIDFDGAAPLPAGRMEVARWRGRVIAGERR